LLPTGSAHEIALSANAEQPNGEGTRAPPVGNEVPMLLT